MNRRDLFKFLAGIGLGAVTIETYERLYHIPMLETMFRKELEYWINQYNTAREEVERLTGKLRKREDEISSLRSDLTKSKEELEHLIQQYNTAREEVSRLSEVLRQSVEEINSLKEKTNYWETQYNTAREEVGRLNSTINKIDGLERESTLAIEYYRGRMDEAIRKLKEIIERYRVLLGDERVSFEYSTLKILEDLKLTQEKLQKVLPYFPLILNFSWKPTRVVNDKIYSIKVIFEVITPLSSLKEVEVMLIPVEYRYFITKYGMREEDYNKVFPEEEVRSVKINPMNLEREVFSVDFEDLKGGREYIVKARVEDVAGNEKRVAVKTPYIRQFENIAKTDNITVLVPYYLWYREDRSNWEIYWHKYTPLLGEYSSNDQIIISKHIDWATGHGIDGFLVSWSRPGDPSDNNLKLFIKNPLANDVQFAILYETLGRLKNSNPGWNLSDKENVEILDKDFSYLRENYFSHSSYFKFEGNPLVYMYEGKGIFGDISKIKDLKEKYGIFLVSDHGHPWANPEDIFPAGNPLAIVWGDAAKMFDGITSWLGGYSPDGNYLGGDYETQIDIGFSKWESWALKNEKNFIPSITPEFDNRYSWGDPNSIPLPRSPELFEKRLKIALKYVKTSKIVMIGTWNDFFESTTLEPSREYGFIYIELIKKIVGNK
jgi:hypothetical protein